MPQLSRLMVLVSLGPTEITWLPFDNGAVGAVTTASPTSLTVTSRPGPRRRGSLSALVVTNGSGNGSPVQIATVTPVITSSVANWQPTHRL